MRKIELQFPGDVNPGEFAAFRNRFAVIDKAFDNIYLFNEDGKFISAENGENWGDENLNQPTDIYTIDDLNLYISDFFNRRIVRMDKDLNYISSHYFLDENVYPYRLVLSRQGIIFVLDQENSRIVRISTAAKEMIAFGGQDYGEFRLIHPLDLTVTDDKYVVVLDTGLPGIMIFDRFGNPIKIIRNANFSGADYIFSQNGEIFILNSEKAVLYVGPALKNEYSVVSLPIIEQGKIISAYLYKTILYVLTKSNIVHSFGIYAEK